MGGNAVANNAIFIERDTIVLVHSKLVPGASATTVTCHFCVVNIYEKYYNKWFMSKQPFKKWRHEAKPYKIGVHMMKKNVLDECTDQEFCCGSVYRDDKICKAVEDEDILNVIGKLQQCVVVP